MIKRLRIKFTAIIMTIVIIMLGIIMGMILFFTKHNLETDSLHMMEAIAGRPFQLGSPGNPKGFDPNIRLPYFVMHVDPNGKLTATNGGYYDLSNKDFLEEMMRTAVSSSEAYGVIPEYNLRYYKQKSPVDQCIVFADMSSEKATLRSMTKTCAAIGGASMIVFLILSILLSKWAVSPVEQAWKQQKQFIADASHELKTPLAVILTNSELAMEDEYSDEEKQHFIKSISTVSKHMRVLVEQMLELARSESSSISIDSISGAAGEPVNFSEAVKNTLLSYEALLFESGHPVSYTVADGLMVKGNRHQLTQILEILLDNANKYAFPNGRIHVELVKAGNHKCRLSVANDGDPIPKDIQKQLFKRFYRADSSRTRDGSFGLGLSIAENIVSEHKGTIRIETADHKNVFHVFLPIDR